MRKLIVIIFSLVLFCILVGCKSTEKLQNINTETRIEYRDKYHRDSIYIRDSVIIYVKGDTVFKDRWHTEWKEKESGDTIILTAGIPSPHVGGFDYGVSNMMRIVTVD